MQRTRLLNQSQTSLRRSVPQATRSIEWGRHETEHHPVPDRVAACPADQVLTIDARSVLNVLGDHYVMSRSRRKTPIVGHTTCGSEREDKKLWHQRWRTRERTALTSASPEALSAHLPLLENQPAASGRWARMAAPTGPSSASRHGGSHRQSQGTQPARTRLPEKAPAYTVIPSKYLNEISRHLFKLSC